MTRSLFEFDGFEKPENHSIFEFNGESDDHCDDHCDDDASDD